jgi:hypothetical protein
MSRPVVCPTASTTPGWDERRTNPASNWRATWAPCEHAFVTAQGSAYSRLRRAIERKNVLVAWATAAELEHVDLGDALALVLLALDDHDAPRFDKRPSAGTRACAGRLH